MKNIGFAILVLLMGCADPAVEEAAESTSSEAPLPELSTGPGSNNNDGTGAPSGTPPGQTPEAPAGSEGSPITEPPPEEVCDGFDNNGDGQIDEGGCVCVQDSFCFPGPPEARGLGVCKDGVQLCDSSREFLEACVGAVGPSPEMCDGLDNNCDGEIDEDCCVADPSCEPPEIVDHLFSVGQQNESVPVDFVMVIDNSGSMRDTVRQVETNLGAFSNRLVQANIDYRFIMISELARSVGSGGTAICVPEPMGGPRCADSDRFRHLDEEVGSHSALSDLVKCYENCGDNRRGGYRDVLRPGSLLQYIVVTDDEARMSWSDFQANMANLGVQDFIMHGVVGLQDRGCVDDVGNQYIQGAGHTGGELLNICDQNWGTVLDVILESTVNRLLATFALADTPDPESIEVFRVDGPQEVLLEAWRYDAASNAVILDAATTPPAGTPILIRYAIAQ